MRLRPPRPASVQRLCRKGDAPAEPAAAASAAAILAAPLLLPASAAAALAPLLPSASALASLLPSASARASRGGGGEPAPSAGRPLVAASGGGLP